MTDTFFEHIDNDQKEARIRVLIGKINDKLPEIDARIAGNTPASNREAAIKVVNDLVAFIDCIAPNKLAACVEGDYTNPPPNGDRSVTVYVMHKLSKKTLPQCWGVTVDGSILPSPFDNEQIAQSIFSNLEMLI